METHIGFVPLVTMVVQKLKYRWKSKIGKLRISNQNTCMASRLGKGRWRWDLSSLWQLLHRLLGKSGRDLSYSCTTLGSQDTDITAG